MGDLMEKRDEPSGRTGEDHSGVGALAKLGIAFWTDPERCRSEVMNTFFASALLGVGEESRQVRVCRALLQKARRIGIAANTQENLRAGRGALAPFHRLAFEKRLVLVLAHDAAWSYEKVGRALERPEPEVAELLWSARTELAALRRALGTNVSPKGAVAHGNPPVLPTCPPMNAASPWTQRFLDDAFDSGRERLFLQNHLMACPRCRQALTEARDLLSEVDLALASDLPGPLTQAVSASVSEAWDAPVPTRAANASHFLGFLRRRPDVAIAIGAALGAVIALALR